MALRVLPGLTFAKRTTLRLGGRSQAEIVVESSDDATGLACELKKHASRPFVLGHGSNLLVMEGELDLAVITLASGEPANVAAVNHPDAPKIVARAPGGLMLPRLVAWAAKQGFSGLEGLAGIPGTVGGAVAMNAGSFSRQTADVLTRVHLWDMAEGPRWITPDAWEASYRHFAPKGVRTPWLVLEAELTLTIAGPRAVRATTDETLAQKKAVQPINAATCGCAFKNPPGLSAGKLLDEAGFKGKTLGGMGFSPMHANFLVNNGSGTASQALTLIDEAKASVRARFGVELELEVRVVQ